jgi:type II secretory ATPase GspE/PulE/Tfp pilus assembly ATPase PilB-like protein
MGVEPYLIPPVLIVSIAQRLARKLCVDAGVDTPLTESLRQSIISHQDTLPPEYRFPIPEVVYEAGKTPTCPTGMRGRQAVFEVLEMSPAIEKIVLENPVDSKIWAAARAQGMLTMQEDAMLKAFTKQIPFSEVSALSSVALDADEPVPEAVPVTEAPLDTDSILAPITPTPPIVPPEL